MKKSGRRKMYQQFWMLETCIGGFGDEQDAGEADDEAGEGDGSS